LRYALEKNVGNLCFKISDSLNLYREKIDSVGDNTIIIKKEKLPRVKLSTKVLCYFYQKRPVSKEVSMGRWQIVMKNACFAQEQANILVWIAKSVY
jgi:hypothetical protein